ncbi:MAG: TorF family putative porin [Pseudomonadota bacterium]
MKKFIGAAMLVGAAVAGTSGVAHAETTVSGNVAFTSDYVWRGLSQSGNDFAVQGGADASIDEFYVGTWASSVDFGTGGSNTELDLYAGWKPTTGPVSWDFGAIGYFYAGSTDAIGDLDFYELKGVGSFAPFGDSMPLTLTGSVYYTPDFSTFTDSSGGDVTGLYGEVKASYAFSDAFTLNGSWGSQNVDDVGAYTNYKIDGAYSAYGFGFDLAWTSTDNAEEFVGGSNIGDDKIILTVSRAL